MVTPDPRTLPRAVALALVGVGGAIGTAGRQALLLVTPPAGVLPLAILVENLLGAFLLGMLVTALARRGPDTGGRRAARLLLGTGMLGGFTTYSALAVDAVLVTGSGAPGMGLLYGLATVVLGALATLGGIAAGAFVPRPTARPRP